MDSRNRVSEWHMRGRKINGPRWRNFKLPSGAIVSIGRLDLGSDGVSWAATYERSHRYGKADPSGGGRTLREAIKNLRLSIMLDRDPKLEQVHKRMIKK